MAGRDERHEETRRRALADLERLGSGDGHSDGGERGAKFGPDDPIEIWGKRIGRSLGILFLVYLIYWLSTKIV